MPFTHSHLRDLEGRSEARRSARTRAGWTQPTRGALLGCMLAAACVVVFTAPAHAGGLRLAFQDEFDGDELDRSRWATRYIYADGTLDKLDSELQNYRDNRNHVVADGALSLVARARADGSGRFESGMIRSRQTFYYGYFEARVRLPEARGVWPAFWLNSDYDARGRLRWPPEIDIFEYVIEGRHEKPNMIHSSVAVSRNGAQGGGWLFRHPKFNQRWTYFSADEPLNRGWHVVALLWKPDRVSMYLDGVKVYTRGYRWVYEDGDTAGPAHILFNLAVGGNWAGRNGVDADAFPQALVIDYVRVCQYDGERSRDDARCIPASAPSRDELVYSTTHHDLARSRLVSASLSTNRLEAGQRLRLRYEFDAVPLPRDVSVRSSLVNAAREVVASSVTAPRPGTSTWRGRQTVTQSLILPADVAPGTYQVVVGLGSDRPIPLEAAPAWGAADGRLRFGVGSVTVRARR